MKFYVLQVEGDVSPELHGPFPNSDERDVHAQAIGRQTNGEDGVFWLDIDESGIPEIGAYSGAFMEPAYDDA